MGRLQGRGCSRQGAPDARERSWPPGFDHLQRAGPDLLRPLDVQARRGGAPRRAGRDPGPHPRERDVRMGCGARFLVGGAIQTRSAGAAEHRIRGLGDARRGPSCPRPSEPQPRFAHPRRGAPRVPSGGDRDQCRRGCHERIASRPLGKCRGQDPRERSRADPRGGPVHGALGSQGDRPRRERRLDLQRRGGQRVGRRGDARRRRGAGSGAAPHPADAAVHSDHGRGERLARERGVHAGPARPARADRGGDQPRCHQRPRGDA